jgi:hypothetical protein
LIGFPPFLLPTRDNAVAERRVATVLFAPLGINGEGPVKMRAGADPFASNLRN